MSRAAALGLGAIPDGRGGTHFELWAPHVERVDLHIGAPGGRHETMTRDRAGYHRLHVPGVGDGTPYLFRLDGGPERPDPASRAQPGGVHGPSVIVELPPETPAPSWRGLPLDALVIYEIHVGTFSSAGTFDGVVPELDRLAELGVTALEIMPVAAFPGERNWGYDGVAPFAVQASYGGVAGLARLVRACHERGLVAILDVVYNHLGPEGNYLAELGPYFTDAYRTPWGPAINLDGPGSDEVRRYFVENALWWIRHLGFDGLRLDAVHALHDRSARPFLEELAATIDEEAERCGRALHLIAESDANDARLVTSRACGGIGLAATWSDDLHHALHARLTGEREGYYADFGELDDLATALGEPFVYAGRPSRFRGRRHGRPAGDLPGCRFVVCSQNHDQVGNRREGERLSSLVPPEAARLAAALVLLSPWLPLLFMGEEYGEPAPFLYFTSHGDPALVEAVRRGRREEFAAFGWSGVVPDPQDPATFLRSRIDPRRAEREPHASTAAWYRELLRLRREHPALGADLHGERPIVVPLHDAETLLMRRGIGADEIVAAFHTTGATREVHLPVPRGRWRVLLDSADPRWGGPGVPAGAVVESNGDVALAAAPYACWLLGRPAGA